MGADFTRVAIVNRGEAAMRFLNGVAEYNRERGTRLRTLALYTEPDARAWFVREADDAMSLGPATYVDPEGRRKVTYLDLERLEAALRRFEAQAVWVGWGFVSEHAEFAEMCERAGIVFIGPTSGVMRRLGDKVGSKRLAEAAQVPVVPWGGAEATTPDEAREHAERLGYPLMVKASAGGGGRGIRRVESGADIDAAYQSARAEAEHAFGDARVFLEKVVLGARHLEVQVVADAHGTVWALGLRDCSVQRRNQKVLEESSSTVLDAVRDADIRASAVRLCQAAGYRNAGTVEFLVDPGSGDYFFMEVNARLQVEHPVTEMTTGADLVKMQLDIARGERLVGEPPSTHGHAIEARLNAEDAERGFSPAPGRLTYFRMPSGPGVRVDTGVTEGDDIAAEFDSMIAKIVAWGGDRSEALARLRRALAQCRVVVDGGTTNKAFLLELLDDPALAAGDFDTGWLDRITTGNGVMAKPDAQVALVMAAIEAYDSETAIQQAHFYATAARGRPEVAEAVGHRIEFRYAGHAYPVRVGRIEERRYRVEVSGRKIEVELDRLGAYERRLSLLGRRHRVVSVVQGPTHLVEVEGIPHTISRDDGGAVRSPSPGVVIRIGVSPGDTVEVGDPLLVMESMKMETKVAAPFSGRIRAVEVAEHVQVDAGAVLVRIEAVDGDSSPSAEGISFDFAEDGGGGEADGEARCSAVFGSLRAALLGYDSDSEDVSRIAQGQRAACAELPHDHPALLAYEEDILGIFADICALSRREPDPDAVAGGDEHVRSAQEYLFMFLRLFDGGRDNLPPAFLDRLSRALARYGVASLDRTPQLEEALHWMFRAQRRKRTLVPSVAAILDRRLAFRRELAATPTDEFRHLLNRLITATEGRIPSLCDLARDVRYHYYDEPVIRESKAAVAAEAEEALARLTGSVSEEERTRLVGRLVDSPQPIHPILIGWMQRAAMRALAVEIMVRRYYRIRDLQMLEVAEIEGHPVAEGRYGYAEETNHLVATYARIDDLDAALRTVGSAVAAVPEDRRVLVDLYLWDEGAGRHVRDDDTLAAELGERLAVLVRGRHVHRIVVTVTYAPDVGEPRGTRVYTYRDSGDGSVAEEALYRNLHPMLAKRLDLWRLDNFEIERLPSVADIYLFRAVAHENGADERLIALAEVRDITSVHDEYGNVVALPQFERILTECLSAIRAVQSHRPEESRFFWNRIIVYLRPPLDLPTSAWRPVVEKLAPATRGLGLEKVVVRFRHGEAVGGEEAGEEAGEDTVLHISSPGGRQLVIRRDVPRDRPIRPLSEYRQKVARMQRRGLVYPYELLAMITPDPETNSRFPPGEFVEHDLDAGGRLEAVERPPGQNTANLVCGLITSHTDKQPEGMTRVVLLGDPSKSLGSLAEAECRRIIAAVDLAEARGLPVEWFALSSGAKISMQSGTENMDWIGAVLRRIITFTQAGGEVNVVVTGINVGAQPYWNAEATMLMHTRGILVMIPDSAMVLTGKQALDFSGGVSAEDNLGIGGYERVMGPNGQAQYWAQDLDGACDILYRHYEHTYVVPGERFPRRAATSDPRDRDVRNHPLTKVDGSDLDFVGDVFSDTRNPERKKGFEIRSVLRAVTDQDHEPLERWSRMRHADTAVVWDAHIGGIPVCLVGFESHQMRRSGFVPADGPAQWTSGTLFPQSSKKTARAINAASGNRPVVVLANLSGFDGSPESMRLLQLEFGAEIGRAVVNFSGPLVFCVVSRYHGGAFVVFAKTLNESLEVAAVEGSYASVIGGAPAAAVVFARDVDARTRADQRVMEAAAALDRPEGDRPARQADYDRIYAAVRSEKLGEVAAEFSDVHTIHRALEMGSVDRIIPGEALRPYVVDALERGIALHEDAATRGER